ncbi:putative U6 snRNA-associated Sm-like protein LSm4 [Plasmodium gaboni]|uniref:U6 snRNA-associated Sm-like protein LSm4 n=1 Tax=Plasmodium gaboni TaxID=647221 RepID=A0A151LIE0_9APIC|nr:putative U6 snRNA-associated Sm-like protein LSm4 [Plasmodium gaboni]XP_028538777.1 U6 snRNA-associated Sm-like protein LSm4, putative [Plasmodium sp. gorilla clade G2]SOV23154.1 U6 snRNA-associated Sm-like protein LSm4, putative [Plasmodium sp. DRC-Itaito]KYN98713.1 putative U6 snRNA-associated Sm-like protein LSm4 [Plasmodium gaboni]SOV15334.1 U6 snRNA-associated Sm-like protein LSm4, putative [Plasmodium gaboni]SOV15360.1 U6 snRNA-associated Sm-like protein LSm4, putative [Plasmodium sp.
MVFPLTLLKCSQNQPVMVELKNGETYSGFLVFCDRFMNLHMKNIICTSKDGDKFWKISECYVRGNSIKYIRVQDQAIEQAIEETAEQKARNMGRGRGGRGRGRGGMNRGTYGRGRGGAMRRGGRGQ